MNDPTLTLPSTILFTKKNINNGADMTTRLLAAITISLIALSSACTKKETAPESAAPQAQATPAETTAATAATPAGKPQAELTLTTEGDNLYFNKKDLEAKAGQVVKLTFKNGASAASNMNHNWVLAKPGTEQTVATEGMQAGETKDWVQEGPNVLAHTKLTKPGETASVTFTAPAAGDYPYLCTFPGHSVTMKGTLHVK
jgi:azurin